MTSAWRPLGLASALCLLGAAGHQAGETEQQTGREPPIVDPRTGLANLCEYPTYVVIGQWTSTPGEEVPRMGIFTRGSLLVERVLRDESGEIRAGQTVEILVPGGELDGRRMEVSGKPPPRVGEWWFIAMALWTGTPERVATRRLPPQWITHIPDELALRSVAERLCEAHPEGIYSRDLTNRDMEREAVSLLRRDAIPLGPRR